MSVGKGPPHGGKPVHYSVFARENGFAGGVLRFIIPHLWPRGAAGAAPAGKLTRRQAQRYTDVARRSGRILLFASGDVFSADRYRTARRLLRERVTAIYPPHLRRPFARTRAFCRCFLILQHPSSRRRHRGVAAETCAVRSVAPARAAAPDGCRQG